MIGEVKQALAILSQKVNELSNALKAKPDVYFGTVDSVSGDTANVVLDGNTEAVATSMQCLCVAGDRVTVVRRGTSLVTVAVKGGEDVIQHSNINAKAANNGITSNTWPSVMQGLDSNGLRTSFFGEAVKSDGGIGAGVWAYNYDANGNSVGSNSLYVGINKDGSMYYGIGDKSAFLTALGIGTTYESNKDSLSVAAGQDTYTQGAKITLPAGKYVIYTQWAFNSGSGTTASTTVGVGNSSGIYNDSRSRVWQAGPNWIAHSTTYLCTLSAQTDIYTYGSSSIARTGCGSFIRAIKVG